MDLGGYIGLRVHEAIVAALKEAQPELTAIARAGGQEAAGGLLGDVQRISSTLDSLLNDIPLIGGLLDEFVNPLKAAEDAGGKFGLSFGWGYYLGYALWQLSSPVFLPFQHGIANLAQTAIFDPDTAAQLQAKGIIGEQYGRSEAAGGNMSGEHYDKLVAGARAYPSTGELLQLLQRQLAGQDDVRTALTLNGVPVEWQDRLIGLARTLLSPADYALAVLRGNVKQDFAEGQVANQGIVPADFQTLIDNTGEPPGLEQMVAWYRREILDLPTLERGIRQSRVRDEWIPHILAARFVPPTTADATRAFVQNYIPFEQAQKIAAQNGIDPEDYRWVAESWGDPLSRTEAGKLYHRGVINLGQFKQAIRESRLKLKYTDDAVALAETRIPFRTVNTLVNHGIFSPEQAIAYLMSDGYSHQDAAALVSSATSGRTAVHKNLTQGMIVELYEAKAINQKEAISYLELLGWNAQEAQFTLDVADARVELAEQKRAITAIRKAFLAHRITELDARTRLGELGVLSNQAEQLLREWNDEIAGQVQELTPAEIAGAVHYGGIDWNQGVAKLVQLGYTRNDAGILLSSHNIAVPRGINLSEVQP